MPFILVITDASTYRYEVHFQKSMDCGGAYIKLLSDYDGLRLVSVIFLWLFYDQAFYEAYVVTCELSDWIPVKLWLVDLL